MKIHIAKLSHDVVINDFDSWSPEAVRNVIVVGLGRILNDSVAGVARSDNPATFHDRCLAKINTRLGNLRNADVRTPKSGLVLTAEEEAAILEMRAARANDSAVKELREMNAAA
jgi:hypothetical protein